MVDSDDRTYIRVHDGLARHPKIVGLSDKAFRLLIETWGWCSEYLTDGYVPQTVWAKLGTARARKELVDAGLVFTRATGGVECHDYLSHQRSAAQVAELREKKKSAAAKGNHERWHVGPKGKPSAACAYCPNDDDAPTEEPPPDQQEHLWVDRRTPPNGIAPAIASGGRTDNPPTSVDDPHPSPETEEVLRTSQTETDPLATRGGSRGESHDDAPAAEAKTASRKRSARNDGHRIPEDWWPSDSDRDWFRENCPNLVGEGTPLTQEFVGYWQTKPGKDGRKLDWSLTWQTWMRRENRNRGNRYRGRPQTSDIVASGRDYVAAMEAEEAAAEGRLAPVHQLTRGA
jgi:hypothetical protein